MFKNQIATLHTLGFYKKIEKPYFEYSLVIQDTVRQCYDTFMQQLSSIIDTHTDYQFVLDDMRDQVVTIDTYDTGDLHTNLFIFGKEIHRRICISHKDDHNKKMEYHKLIGTTNEHDIIDKLPHPRNQSLFISKDNIRSIGVATRIDLGPHIRYHLDPDSSCGILIFKVSQRKNALRFMKALAIISIHSSSNKPCLSLHNRYIGHIFYVILFSHVRY